MITQTPIKPLNMRRLYIGIGIVAVLAGVLYLPTRHALDKASADMVAVRRSHCIAPPPPLVKSISVAFRDLGTRRAVGWSAARRSPTTWFVSATFIRKGLPRGTTGDIATWVVADRRGKPATGGAQAVDREAKRFSRSVMSATAKITDLNGVESRWCAKDGSKHQPRAG